MGAMASMAASCFGSAAATCACKCVKSCCKRVGKRGSLTPYFVLLFLVSAIAFVLRFWGGPLVVHISFFSADLCSDQDACYGFIALTRISFALFLFFALHFCVPATSRLGWFVKSFLFAATLVGTWFIPNPFYDVYADVARVVSGFFLVAQLVILVDFAYRWNDAWTSDERPYHKLVLLASAVFYAGSIAFAVLSYLWFAHSSSSSSSDDSSSSASSSCSTNIALTTTTLVWTLAFSALSISNLIPYGGGLLPSSIVTLYSFYTLFTALASDASSCNTLYSQGGYSVDSRNNVSMTVVSMLVTVASLVYAAWNVHSSGTLVPENEDGAGQDASASSASSASSSASSVPPTTANGAAANGVSAEAPSHAYQSMSDDDLEQQQQQQQSKNKKQKKRSDGDDNDNDGDDDDDDGDAADRAPPPARFSNGQYRRFFLTMMSASMYLCMLLTNWGDRATVGGSDTASATLSAQNYWIKASMGWVVMALYTWSLVAPLVLRNRSFE